MFSVNNAKQKPARSRLSPREIDIVREFAKGATSSQASELLGISQGMRTVHAHRILDKFCCRSMPAAVAIAFAHQELAPGLVDEALRDMLDGKVGAVDSLTVREYEVLCLEVRGFTALRVARMLGISFNTVRSYRQNMLKRLGVRRLNQAAAIIVYHGRLTIT